MQITKGACDAEAFRRPHLPFRSARAAFRAYLDALGIRPGEKVLLPAYIGWSPREGSGVFDPVRESGTSYAFYRMDERLRVDLDDVARRLAEGGVRVVVAIHYFGAVDPGFESLAALARRAGAEVVEDEAHAWLSELFGRRAGRLGDACIVSLHKLLPVPEGGVLVLNGAARERAASGAALPAPAADAWGWDLRAIAERRRANAEFLRERLAPLEGSIDALWPEGFGGDVPQSFPVLVRGISRDALYHEMNGRGMGVVSLYHTLVNAVGANEHPEAHRLSRTILNLPVHQDVDAERLDALVACLEERVAAGVA
jgi:dTDP-4-amino-4,6-dideoxygalactose transaminase